jgi:arylsulfatase A-like enzyme
MVKSRWMRLNSAITGCCLALALGHVASASAPARAPRPSIVYILADDLGYGDVRCFNGRGKIATPHLDRLAAAGMRFTDAHSSSSVCTPTRYGILTGRYNWRSSLRWGVLFGYSSHLIEAGRLTVPEFLRQNGYRTACIGKWHLGMDWPRKQGEPSAEIATGWEIDYKKPIKNGPTTVGFDDYFGISGALDMPPFVFIARDHTVGLPTVEKTWVRTGPAAADFDAQDVLPRLVRSSASFIEKNAAAARAGQPFFLYVPLSAPHTPIVPTREWRGKSGLNSYGDFVMQVDHAVGQILASIDRAGLGRETLVIFTSDNGCSPVAEYPELLAKGHDPSAGFRGTKADIFEGGHRVPFIVRWPGKVRAGTMSNELVCLNDLFATCAEIVGARLPDAAAEDSVSMLPAFLGTLSRPLHEAVVHHSFYGSFAIRQGRWKLALCPDSGGWSHPWPFSDEADGLPEVQLYDLGADPRERRNLQAEHPEIVDRLTRLLEKYVANGRSTPGRAQPNNGPPVIIQRRRLTGGSGALQKKLTDHDQD